MELDGILFSNSVLYRYWEVDNDVVLIDLKCFRDTIKVEISVLRHQPKYIVHVQCDHPVTVITQCY